MRALGASAGALALLNGDGTFTLVRMLGYPPAVAAEWVGQRYPATLQAPIPEAVRARAPIWLESTEAILARYPDLAAQLTAEHRGAWATVPLAVQQRVFGGVTFLFAEPRIFSEADRDMMLALARQCAQAIDRARLHTAERHARAEAESAREQLALLAEASMELAMSLDIPRTLDTLAHLVVPTLADWCVIDMLAEDGTIETLVVAHADPAREAIGWEMVRRYPIDPDAPGGTAAVLRTLRPELIPAIDDAILAAVAADAEHLRMLKALGMRSTLCVPLVARGRALGTIALVAAESGRSYSAADLPFVEDLARRAALAADNARLYHEAQQAIRLRDTFFSIAAHELKTPLTSLLGQAQLVLRRASREGDLSERNQHSLEVIERQANRLNSMILAMLDTARLEQGQLRLEEQPTELGELVQRVVAELQPTFEQHTIAVSGAGEPLVVLGDAMRLEQVLQNLIGNAVKYSPRGGQVRLLLERDGGMARIAVRDEGIGIPAAAIPQLFQRFYRAQNADEAHITGLGIGLYVVKEIVNLHGGTIAVSSAEGQGSVFRMSLPLLVE
jgi:signal transduction histidine kinase